MDAYDLRRRRRPGPKDFDWNLQQYSITPQREQAVDFSAPYYTVTQAVVTTKGSPIAGATTLAELKNAKLGAAVGTTSLDDANTVIAPTKAVSVFNDNAAAVTALKNGQVDGIVVDLPTAFYLTSAELDNGVIVGQLPRTAAGTPDQFGILLARTARSPPAHRRRSRSWPPTGPSRNSRTSIWALRPAPRRSSSAPPWQP